jgi:hypothetical protein
VELSELCIYAAGPGKNLDIVRKIITSHALAVDSAEAAAESGNLEIFQWLMSSYRRQILLVQDDLLMIMAKNNHLDLATFLIEEGDYVINYDLLLKLSSADVPTMEVLKMLLIKTNADIDIFVGHLPKITSREDLLWLMSFNGGPSQKRLDMMFLSLVDTFDLELLKWFKRKYDLNLNNRFSLHYLVFVLDEKEPGYDGAVARWLVTEGQIDVNNRVLGLTPLMYACVNAVGEGELSIKKLGLVRNLVDICDASLDDIDSHMSSHKNVWTLLLPFWQNIDEDDLLLEDCLEIFLSKGVPPTVVYEALLQTKYADMVERLVDKDKMVIRRYMDAVDIVNLTVLVDMVRTNPFLKDSVDEKGRTAAMRLLLNNQGSEHIRDFQNFGLLSQMDTLEKLCDFAVTLEGRVGFRIFETLVTALNVSRNELRAAVYSSTLTAARCGNALFLYLLFGSLHVRLIEKVHVRLIDEIYRNFLNANRTTWQRPRFMSNLVVKLHNSTQTIVDWLLSEEGRIHINEIYFGKSMMMQLLGRREWKMATELIEKANPAKTYLEIDWYAFREDEDAFAFVKALLVRTDLPDDIFQTLASSSVRYIDLFREGDQAREAVAEWMVQRHRTMRRMPQGRIAKTVMDNILQFDDGDSNNLTTAEMYALPRSNPVRSRTVISPN